MEKFASDCLAAQTLANSVFFISLITIVTIISMIGIIVQIIIMKKYVICMAIHENTRILLVAHQIYLILHCVASIAKIIIDYFYRIVAHTSDLIIYKFNYHDPCMYLSTPLRCFIIRTPVTFTFCILPCSMLLLVAERAIGTYWSAKYERMGRLVAYILILCEVYFIKLIKFFILNSGH
ncbi:unnamed protein product [Dracunculus medinensis]|uniref:G_PROTEIN_RECEP_F1_2 domain-containing protein n=1 Tax=Dracunculus medinensis TaxID=318479 RepID=A0A0N4UD24_DRAME|nr:unnamed protein product [Dracunculus medinensis]